MVDSRNEDQRVVVVVTLASEVIDVEVAIEEEVTVVAVLVVVVLHLVIGVVRAMEMDVDVDDQAQKGADGRHTMESDIRLVPDHNLKDTIRDDIVIQRNHAKDQIGLARAHEVMMRIRKDGT